MQIAVTSVGEEGDVGFHRKLRLFWESLVSKVRG